VAACIAAASVIAKVTRDRLMCRLHTDFPQYGFDVHKGYCTREHDSALEAYGPCPEHRRRFVNVRSADAAHRGEHELVRAGTGGHGEPPVSSR
jgi:ribonuclease HII